MPAPVFSFVPEKQLGQQVDETYRVSIFKKAHLYFPKNVCFVYDLKDKYIRMFADIEKKAIGWQICEGKTDLDVLNDARHMIANSKSGAIILGIGKLLKALGFENEKAVELKDLEVKKYKSLLDDRDIWYIELKKYL